MEVSHSQRANGAVRSYEVVPADEQIYINRLIENIRRMLEKRYPDKETLRDAHPKMHGLVKAVLEVDPRLPQTLRHGLFSAAGHEYRGWVRFSSEHHDPQSDHKRDTRGLALKLLDIPGDKLLDGEESSPHHDFIFLSAPRFVARNVAEFSETVNALVNHSIVSWLRSIPSVVRLMQAVKVATSPLETEYFSVVPAHLGPHAVKYIVRPRRTTKRPLPPKSEPDFLRTALEEQLAEDDHCFDVYVQMFVDEATTPIEDPAVCWTVEPQRVATLRILKQTDFNRPAQRQIGEDLAFNPFRCLPEHQPLGGINRARRQVYRAIAAFRHARNHVRSVEVPAWSHD